MAKVVQKKNNLEKSKRKITCIYWVGYVLAWIGGILFVELIHTEIPQNLCLLIGGLGLAGAVAVHSTRDTKGIYEGGTKGERDALAFLKKNLPDSYYVVANAIIYFENRQNELDFIVVGPTGVFVVEVKNYSGSIQGSYFDKTLIKRKGKYTDEIDNPIYQAKKQIDILAKYLKASGLRCWVDGAVLKIHKNGGVSLSDVPNNGVPFFAVADDGQAQLLQYIQGSTLESLSEEMIQRIVNAI